MPRIRTIKPEFWDSPGVETLEPLWRLLYIAMWNWADDHGRGKAEARELMGFVFPRDEGMTLGEFRRGLGEVRRVFGVKFYQVGGRSYYAIPSWDKHQKIDKRSAGKYPPPDEGTDYDPDPENGLSPACSQTPPSVRRDPAETPPSPRRDAGAGTGEQGNRGTGEIGSELASASSGAVALRDDAPATAQTIVGEWIDHCTERPPNRVVGQASREIKQLLDEGTDPDRVRSALAEMNDKGLHPSTLASLVHSQANRTATQPLGRRQSETDNLFDRAMQRALSRETNQ